MADPVILEVAGLQLSNNTFSASPQGSMSKALNCAISQKGVVQPRNGQPWATNVPTGFPFAMVEFQGNVIANFGTSKTSTSMGLGYDSESVPAGALTAYGSGPYNPVGDNGSAIDYARMHFTLASLFLHFACATGPHTLETYNGTPRRSGLSRVPDFTGVTFLPAGTQPGVIPYNSSVAYRYTHKRITSTGQVLESPPSNRFVVTNRYLIPAGGLVRTGAALVTITFEGAQLLAVFALPFDTGDTVNVYPADGATAEADFPAGNKVITGFPTASTETYAEAGANVASTIDYEVDPGPLAAQLIVPLAADVIAGDIIVLYKSAASSASNIEPPADVYICGEHLVTSGDVVTGSVTFEDYTPESVLRIPLYTNPSDGDGQGERGANFAPPIYLDAANFDSRTFYLSTTGQQYLNLQMLGVGGPDGVQDGDTITITDGVTTKTYTFKHSPSNPGDTRLIDDGLPSYNIACTTYFLCVLAGSDFKATTAIVGATSENGFPGAIRIERLDYVQTPVQVKVSRPKSWSPALQAAVETNSFSNAQANGLVWGKLGQPEAVPVLNTVGAGGVGVSNYYGRRCFGLRNSLIILKEGDGVWSLTGSGGSYSLLQISTANIIAPDCACIFSDAVWAYTDQGIMKISDTGGVVTVSRQLETVLNEFATLFPTLTYAYSFAVPYETERRVMFFIPVDFDTSDGSFVMAAFCYSAATNAWTYVAHDALCGLVSTSHHLWTGINEKEVFPLLQPGRLTKERKTATYLDIADAQWSVTLATTADPLVVSLSSAASATAISVIRKGFGISQLGQYFTKVEEVLGGGLFRLAEEQPWLDTTATVYASYPVEAQFLPSGTPGSRKVLSRLFTLFKPESFTNLYGVTTLFTDQTQNELEIDSPSLGYGLTPYGQGSYGDPSPMVHDSNPPNAKYTNAGQFFPGMKFDEVWISFKLQGVGMQISSSDAPVGRGK